MASSKEGEENAKKKLKRTKKNKRICYSKEAVAFALDELRNGKRNAEVSRKYNISESTLRAKRLGLYADKKPGPSTVLTTEEEKELVHWIIHCCEKGFPVTKNQLQESVREICVKMNKKNPFTDNIPGRGWYELFMKRNPEISKRVSEKISLNRAKVSEYSLRQWFEEVGKFLKEHNLTTIEPSRIFNCDESGILLNPISSSVLAPKGQKNVFTVVNNNEKENITTLVTASADGNLAPTFVLFAGNSLPNNTVQLAPNDFAFGFSKTGWMLAENFYEYIANVFDPWLSKNNIQRPVILFIDSHASHITLHLSKFCSEKQILLIALHPNATHIMQPLDVSLFRTLKANWQKTVQKFCRNSFVVGIQKSQFAPLLKSTLDSLNLKQILQNGFKKCGLYPFDVNAIDFNKVIKRIEDSNLLSVNNSELVECNDQAAQKNTVDVFEKFLKPEQKKAFRLNDSPVWKGIEKEEELFNIWYKLSYPSSDLSSTLNNFENDPKLDFSNDSGTVPDLNQITGNTHVQKMIDIGSTINSDKATVESRSSDGNENDCVIMELEVDINQNIPVDVISKSIVLASNSDVSIAETVDIHLVDIKTAESCTEKDSFNNDSLELDVPLDLTNNNTISKKRADTPKINSSSSPNVSKSLTANPLCDITNSGKQKMSQSTESVQNFLFCPSDDLLQNKNKERTRNKVPQPSVITTKQWQQVEETKKNQKRIKIEEVEMKKKARVEKREKSKLEKEALKAKREEKKFLREKQQEKLATIEEKKKASEKKFLKNKEKKRNRRADSRFGKKEN